MEVAEARPARSGNTRNFLATYAWLILAITAEVVLVALLLPGLKSPTYASSSVVLVEPGIYPNGAPSDPDMGTERALASSGVITQSVAAIENLKFGQVKRSALSVSVPVDTRTLVISYTSADPEVAKRRAQDFAKAYVDYRRLLDARLRRAGGPAGAASSKPPVTATIVTPAQNAVATGRGPLLYAGFGLFIGALLGLATAVAWDKFRDRPRAAGDVEAATALPVLATLPRVPTRRQSPRVDNLVLHDPGSRSAEAFRYLRARLLHEATQSGHKVVMLAGCQPGTSTAATAVNLAAFCAASGQRTILVDANLSQPTVHQWFGFEQPPGLSEALWGHHPAETVLYQTEIAGLRILPAGNTIDGISGELLRSSALAKVFGELRGSADIVIVLAPAVLGVADSVVVGEAAEMVLLVANARRDSREQLRAAVATLEHLGERLIGWVFADVGAAGVSSTPPRRTGATRATSAQTVDPDLTGLTD
jgi:capsular exopolysaccharide synthesis family protein